MSGATGSKRGPKGATTYEESKRLAGDEDPAVRADLAARSDLRPEILYYLAADPSPEVRRRAALNERTPAQADLILARDSDEAVRREVAAKVARLLPHLGGRGKAQAERHVVETPELLARDQAARVRQILAEALRDLTEAPPAVIRRLARYSEDVVACPVPEFSPLLTDQDLIEIIGEGCASGKLSAISRRHGLGETVAAAIVGTDDRAAVAALLANTSAQIREETLNTLVDQARGVTAWHEPLVDRPKLSSRTVRKLATFVAENLLRKLQNRKELDRDTARRVPRRCVGAYPARTQRPRRTAPRRAAIRTAWTKTPCFRRWAAATAPRCAKPSCCAAGWTRRPWSGSSRPGARRASPPWPGRQAWPCASRSSCSRMGGIPPRDVLHARDGVDYPPTPEEMAWQLDFFQALSG